MLGLVLLLIVGVGGDPNFGLAELIRPNLPVNLPEPLPSVAYVGDPVGVLYEDGAGHLAAVGLALLATVPVRAYGTAGFLGVLYHRVHKGLGPQARPFFAYAHRFLAPILVLEVAFTLLFLPALVLFGVSPALATAYAVAALGVYALLLFAPYSVVADGAPLGSAVRRSVRTVLGRWRICVPMAAVGLAVTGLFALLARALIAGGGLVGYLAAGLLFSPLGAVVSLLFLSTYTFLRASPYAPTADVDATPGLLP